MTRHTSLLAFWVFAGILSSMARADEPFTPAPIRVPEGYSVELAAAPPLVKHPMMACFDERGRLFIAESAGLNLRREELEKELPNFIRMLEDTDGDGRFDRSTIFADKMTFPQGCAWYDGALYVASSGAIWKLRDTDGDGVADERIELVSKFGYNGNAADVHGCFISPDGRIYWVGGRHGHEVHDEDGQLISTSKAGGIFSCRPDGSDFRRHSTGGFDNPVEIIFTDTGEIIGTVNILEANPRRDSLVHWVEGGVYPKQEMVDRFGEFTLTGTLLPPIMHFGHVAVSGLCRAEDGSGDLFVTHFNTHEVVRVKLRRRGSTFAAQVHPFLSTQQIDFHATDVLMDADGSMLVIDTGGWFRIGCPTSQIAKPDIPGAIYRIRRTDAPAVDDPRGLQIVWHKLDATAMCKHLNDARPAVRERAIFELSKLGDAAVRALDESLQSSDVTTRRNAVWTLTRIGSPRANALVVRSLHDEDPGVQLAAIRGSGNLRIEAAGEPLTRLVATAPPHLQLEAASALGRLNDASAVPALLKVLESAGDDRMLHHALTWALMQIGEAQPLVAALDSSHASIRAAAVIALGQMEGSPMTGEQIVARFADGDADVRHAARLVITKKPTWLDALAEHVAKQIQSGNADAQTLEAAPLVIDHASVQAALGTMLSPQTPDDHRIAALRLIAGSKVKEPPAAWIQGIRKALEADSPQVVTAAAAAGGIAPSEFDAQLAAIVTDQGRPIAVRLAALDAAVERSLSDGPFDLLMNTMNGAASAEARAQALSILSRSRLSAAQLIAWADVLPSLSNLEIARGILPFGRAKDAESGHAFAAALLRSPARFALIAAMVDRATSGYPADVKSAFAPVYQELQRQAESQHQRLAELERSLSASGDIERGRALFNTKATCVVCHRVGDSGGLIGPDLTTIGRIRTRRDLIESIAFPSSTFAREYETRLITMRDGAQHAGRIARETEDTVYLLNAANQETPLPREQMAKIEISPVSLMPPGLERLLTPQELSDLLAYLLSLGK